MPTTPWPEPLLRRLRVGPVELAVSDAGASGEPVVCIHGSWDDHRSWDAVARELRRDHRVVTYDRRGHSASSDVPGQGTIGEDVRDAADLIEALGATPAHVIGHSYGACIAIVLATTHPELVGSLYLHEPPVFALLADRTPELLAVAQAEMQRAVELLDAGELEAGTIHFVEAVAFGPDAWRSHFDAADRAIMLANVDTWLDQSRDPDRLAVDVECLAPATCPSTLSVGTETLAWFREVTTAIADRVPGTYVEAVEAGAHGTPKSHPLAFVEGFRRHLERIA